MALYTYILLLVFLDYTLTENCDIDNTPKYITWEKELLEYLKCGYNEYHAPRELTRIIVIFFIEAFRLDTEEGVFTVQVWMNTKWKDERLKWDPEKHNGISETDGTNLYLWTPSFEILDSEEFHDSNVFFYSAELQSTGHVQYQHRMKVETWCNVKLTDWPYDVQECSFEFSTRKTLRQEGNFTINFFFKVLEPQGAEWYIFDYGEDNNTKGLTKVNFFLKREAVGLSGIVIYPAFILTVLSILSLCLDVRRKVRLAVICFSLMGHYYFLSELAAGIPKGTHFPPTLLLYYRGSVVLSVIILLSSLFLAAICKFKSTPHNYIKLVNDFVFENNYRMYLVFPRWDFDDATVDSKSSSEDWVNFANVVNSVSMFCVVFAYISIYATYIPKRIDILKRGEFE